MSVHSYHHYTRWSELHPAAYRPQDDLRAAKGIFRAVVGALVAYAVCYAIWEVW